MKKHTAKYITIGKTTIEERPAVKRWVMRHNFIDGRVFDATITAEDQPHKPKTLYVCIALNQKPGTGAIRRMIRDTRPFFKELGYTHADYVIDENKHEDVEL